MTPLLIKPPLLNKIPLLNLCLWDNYPFIKSNGGAGRGFEAVEHIIWAQSKGCITIHQVGKDSGENILIGNQQRIILGCLACIRPSDGYHSANSIPDKIGGYVAFFPRSKAVAISGKGGAMIANGYYYGLGVMLGYSLKVSFHLRNWAKVRCN